MQKNRASAWAPSQLQRRFTKLQLRIVSAVVLIAVTLLLSWAGLASFTLLIIAIACVMIWEWGRIARGTGGDTAAVLQGAATVVAILLCAAGSSGQALLLLAISSVAMLLGLRMSTAASRLSALGVVYVGLPAIALVWLRADTNGLAAVLMLFAIVWATDTFAMVTGKAIGGPQLWARVSPNKTWAGAIGGLAAGCATGAIFVALATDGDLWWYGASVGGVLSIAAQLGDLLESAVKRAGRIKDTSELIPGHGGVLDRMDGIVGAALALPLVVWAVGGLQPAQVLLGG